MKKLTISILGLLLAFLSNSNLANAQSSSYKLLPESSIEITGTSTIHNWECEVKGINFDATMADNVVQGEQLPETADFINSLSLTVPVKNIDSGKGAMNNKIYGALKEKNYPNISFTLSSADIASRNADAKTFMINATGDLTIAGVTKTVSFPVTGSFNDDGNVQFQGTYSLNMTDYNIDPPTAVFGTIKSGDKVTVAFDVVVSNQAIADN